MKQALWLLAVLPVLFSGCTDDDKDSDDDTGLKKVHLSISAKDDVTVGDDPDLQEVYRVFVTIETTSGDEVLTLEPLRFLKAGNGFISEDLLLSEGEYRITQLFAADANDNVLYASPVEESTMASLVEIALPVSFTVEGSENIEVPLEVVSVIDKEPANFGYVAFGLKQVSQSLIKIVAHTNDIGYNIGQVRTWIKDQTTHERRWITLRPSTKVSHEWVEFVVVENGDYDIETFVESPPVNIDVVRLAKTEKKAYSINGSVTAVFDAIKDQKLWRSYVQEYYTLLVPPDACDLDYGLYLDNEARDIYLYYDRFFRDHIGDVLAVTWEEHDRDLSMTGDLHRTLPPLTSSYTDCQEILSQSYLIDYMVIVSIYLKSGAETGDTYNLGTYTPVSGSRNGSIINGSSLLPSARKKQAIRN